MHEAWLKIAGEGNQHFANRRHFFKAASSAMQQILVDIARRKQRLKHGANLIGDELHESRIAMSVPSEELLAVNDALAVLALEDPQAAAAVQMRYFVGLTVPEIAEALDLAPRTEAPGQTLQPTALVHEAWLRLTDSTRQEWRGSGRFFSAAAEAMRRILVENARRKLRLRHGGGLQRVDFEAFDLPITQDDEKCLRVHEALDQLAAADPRKAEVVKLRVFMGLQVQEIAAVMNASEKTVQRDWTFAKAWLSRELNKGP